MTSDDLNAAANLIRGGFVGFVDLADKLNALAAAVEAGRVSLEPSTPPPTEATTTPPSWLGHGV